MGQVVPSVLFHAQALKLIDDLRTAYQTGVGSLDDLVVQIRGALLDFEDTLGTPFFEFEPVVDGEPPLSAKMNRLWDNLTHDINVLEQQADIGRSAAVFAHNLIVTEIMKSKNANARVSNKLKTLQLYSKAVDSSIVTFGDHFTSTDFIDFTKIPNDQRPFFMGDGYVTLGQEGQLQDLTAASAVRILDTSNGFSGNLHEVSGDLRTVTFTRNATATYTPILGTVNDPHGHTELNTDGLLVVQEPIFKAETDLRGDLSAVVDNSPSSWFEYEYCQIDPALRLNPSQNMNFTYQKRLAATADSSESSTTVNWATGPPNDVLQLDLEFDLGSLQTVNFITYVPYNLQDNSNYPVKVLQVQTSIDRTNWNPVLPLNVVIGPSANLAAGTSDTTTVGDAIWSFTGRPMRYIQMSIAQSQPVGNVQLGHVYYLDQDDKRVEGPNPTVTNPAAYYGPDVRKVDNNIQRREVFSGKRWVIGIRDVSIQQINHVISSTVVTTPLRVGGLVDRVSIDADVAIPTEYDNSDSWINFFVSPDDGKNWYQISRVQDDFNGVPEVVAFNDPLPVELQESGVGYYTVQGAVTALRLKVVMHRPANLPSTTPVLHGYSMRVKRR